MTTETLTPSITSATLADVEAISAEANEPEWLLERRRVAWRFFETMSLPDPGDEEWRRTDVRAIPIDGLKPDAAALTLADAAALKAQGVIFTDLQTAAREHGDLVQKYLGDAVRAGEWKYLALNAALWDGGAFLYVPKDVEARAPVQLNQAMASAGRVVFPRTLIVVERNARVVIVDEAQSADGGEPSFVSGAVEIYAGDGAQVDYYSVNRWGDSVYNFNTVRAMLGRDAEFTGVAAGIGSKLTKMRLDVEMPQAGARTQLLGVTFGNKSQNFDYNTLQNHIGQHTISDLQFKSAMTDSASFVWYGVTRINPTAGGSEANQTSRNLLLSKHAKAAPIPILEIQAHDVSKCSHGATAGPVDENELFYMESRAIPRATAEQMLVEGFFATVTDRIPNADVRRRIMDAVIQKLGGAATDRMSFDELVQAAGA
jgi:Fe-S cluster assembly protein SufD